MKKTIPLTHTSRDAVWLKNWQATVHTRQQWQKLVNIVYTAFVMSGWPAVWKKNRASFRSSVWCASQLALGKGGYNRRLAVWPVGLCVSLDPPNSRCYHNLDGAPGQMTANKPHSHMWVPPQSQHNVKLLTAMERSIDSHHRQAAESR